MGRTKTDTTKNLKPFKKGEKRTIEMARKAGRVKTAKKLAQSRINGLLNSKKLTKEERYILEQMRDRNYSEVLNELISVDVQNIKDDDARRKAIDQLQRFMPTKVMTMNTNVNIDMKEDSKEAEEHLKKLLGDK